MHGIYKADIILGTGPFTDGNSYSSCDICGDEILLSHPSAKHEQCGKGAFHQACLDDWVMDEPECPACFKAFKFRRMNEGTRPQLIERLVAMGTQPIHDPQAPSSCSPMEERPSASESDTVTYSPATSKEHLPNLKDTPEPEIAQGDTTIPCTFRSTEGLMSLVMSCQASVQALTGEEVWDLMKQDLLQPTDMIVALRLSSDLDGFSRIYYHRPGTPRDETTLFLTHPNFKDPGTSSSPSSASPTVQGHRHHDDSPVDDQAKVEIEQLTNMVHGCRISAANKKTQSGGSGPYPPTVCGYCTVNGRRAKIITAVRWLKPGENADLTTSIRMGAELEAREQILKGGVKDEASAEVLLLESLVSKLDSLKTNIHDARKGISKLEHQVSHSGGHEDQQALGDPSTCDACGSPLRLPNRRVGRS